MRCKMNYLNKLERKIGKYAIPNLSLWLVVTYALGYLMMYMTPGIISYLMLEPAMVLRGQVWRLVTMTVKKDMGNKFAQIVYEGKWFTPLREAVQAFVESTQKYVTGEVKFKLYKGNIIKAGTTSPYSLYSESLASFTTGDLYDHHDAEGFITLFGLPLKVRAMKMAEIEKNK